jgi:hypothetical protein
VITVGWPARHIAAPVAVAVVGSLLVAFWPVTTGQAAFPGANGRIVFQRESVAGDDTQVDLFTVHPDGLALRRLTATPDLNEFGPVWFPPNRGGLLYAASRSGVAVFS